AAAARGWRVREVPVRALARARARSRFRPLPDGLAIGGFLATRVLARCGVEARAAAAAAGAIFHPDRLRARHAAMLDAAAPWGDSPGTWGWAVGLVATRRLVARLDHWWRHPRRRRATAAAVGIAAAPLALPCVLLQAVAGNRLPDLLSPLVTRVYGQDRLETPPLLPPPGVAVHDVLGAREVSSR
ncbi:MAG TPA: hypothetical protein VFX28_02815, partial [Methylomirabilota bacterium]|nr:hypothetical protein [Methylomirabilota bacterium]